MESKFKYSLQRWVSHHLVPEVQTKSFDREHRDKTSRIVAGKSIGYRGCDLQDGDIAGSPALVCQDEPGKRSALYRSTVQGIHVPGHATGIQELTDKIAVTVDQILLSGAPDFSRGNDSASGL